MFNVTSSRLWAGVGLSCLLFGSVWGYHQIIGSDDGEYPPVPFPKMSPQELTEFYSAPEDQRLPSGTAQEQQAIALLLRRQYVEARKTVDAILAQQPNSVPAIYCLSRIEHRGESNLPRALNSIRAARRILEVQGHQHPEDRSARRWYLCVLEEECSVLQQLDRNADQLRAIALLEELTVPKPSSKIFPLMKELRFDEARTAVEEARRYPTQLSWAVNGLAALEDRLGRRSEALVAAREAMTITNDDSILASNHGLAAYNAFEFSEAEAAMRTSLIQPKQHWINQPYLHIALLCTQQARFPEASDAIQKARQAQLQAPLEAWQQSQAQFRISATSLLLAAGNEHDAVQLAREIDEQPDRAGMTSLDEQEKRMTGSLVRWTATAAALEAHRENRAAESAWNRLSVTDRAEQELKLELWQVEQRLQKHLVGEDLIDAVRPNVPGRAGFETGLSPWWRASVIRLLPRSVAAGALRSARQVPDLEPAAGYLDAMQAELELLNDAPEQALVFAQQALKRLPPEAEKLLRHRVQAIAGEAHWRCGDADAARQQWDAVLRNFPHAFRLLQLSIPIDIQHDGSPAASALANSLTRSPRLRVHPAGYPVMLKTVGQNVSVEMFLAHQTRHVETKSPVVASLEQTVQAAHRQFHERLMTAAWDLSQLDLNSLRGSPSVAKFQARVDHLLGQLSKPTP